MLYDNYKKNVVYSSQAAFPLPKRTETDGARDGRGIVIFPLAPNRDALQSILNNSVYQFKKSGILKITSEVVYRGKIGTKSIILNDRINCDKFYVDNQNIELFYVPWGSRAQLFRNNLSHVRDVAKWMEIIFNRMNDDSMNEKLKCLTFINYLSKILSDSVYAGYRKCIIFDLATWKKSIRECVILNKRLLNNPLSILLYTVFRYPEFLDSLPDAELMITDSNSKQIYITNLSYFNKENFPKIRLQLARFKGIIDSDDSKITADKSEKELKAVLVSEIKKQIRDKVRYQLTGQTNEKSPFDDIDDVSSDNVFINNLEDELNAEAEANETEDDTSQSINPDNLEDYISDLINDDVEDMTEIEELDAIDTDAIAENIANKVKNEKFVAAFMPTRSKAEIARIERLKVRQEEVLPVTMDDVARKSISTSVTGGYIKTTNPNIISSKFVNFDKEYAEKCLEKNIDDSVAILSKASNPIFVTGKKKVDSSTIMDLKETYTYYLEDERGMKHKLVFDVPKIIDGSYVFLNGTKKNIRHQFILKPLVKSGPATVQLVTAYNKVFIYRRGIVNQNTNKITTYLEKNPDRFKVRAGNNTMSNEDYEVPLDFDMVSRYFAQFTIGDVTFFMNINQLFINYKKKTGKDLKETCDLTKEIPVGINNKTKEVIYMSPKDSYTDLLMKSFTDDDRTQIEKIKRRPKFVVASAKIMGRELPLVLLMLYCEGFASVMNKADIEYKFIPSGEKIPKGQFNLMEWDIIQLADGKLFWKKNPIRNELLMNGLKREDMTDFTYEDLENKNTYISLILPKYPGNAKIYNALDNYRDFLLDDKTKEILRDFSYPTELVDLLVVAAGMLSDTKYLIENNLNNMRIRSNEVIADLVYLAVTNAYNSYRASQYKNKPAKVGIKKSIIVEKLLDSDTNMIEEFSTLNPVLELEKQRSVTFKGIRGIQKDRAMTLPRRAYDKTMLGTVGITTSPDANVGIIKQLTLEPQITSTYGYIDASKSEHPEQLNAANVFTTAELLQPLGAMHDDPDRTSMSYKQTKYMIPINDADPVLVGNKVEAVVPYLLSDEFVVTAKEDGSVIDIGDGYVIIKYKSGTKQAIDISPRVRKNSSAGFWIDNTLKCELKVGDKFKVGDVLAYNDKHFTKNKEDRGASMNLGALCKIAISSQWDIFEDSVPISRRLSEKLATKMVDEKHVTFSPNTYIEYIVKVGDKIKAGDPLVRFSDGIDEHMQALFDKMREEQRENIIESAKTTVTSKFTGEIADIKIYTTTDPSNLHPSLEKIVREYWNKISKRNEKLRKNANEGDLQYYCAGQVINEVAEVVKPSDSGKLNGYMVNTGEVLILFYIKYDVAASKGDKVVSSVCKGVVSHVFEEGMEPFSEYRPDEPIDTIIAPLAVAARKVPAIFLNIFTNKLLIELKHQLKEIYLEER